MGNGRRGGILDEERPPTGIRWSTLRSSRLQCRRPRAPCTTRSGRGGVGVDEPETEPLVFESTEHVDLHEEPPRKDLPTTGIGF